MRRILIIVLPIVILVLFIFIMLSGNILKKPLGEDDDIPGSIDDIIIAVSNDKWDEANGRLMGLENAWNKVVKRVQFSSERDEINMLTTSITRLRGAIEAEDKSGALMELYEAYNHWSQLGK